MPFMCNVPVSSLLPIHVDQIEHLEANAGTTHKILCDYKCYGNYITDMP